jgi:hypothetical protein
MNSPLKVSYIILLPTLRLKKVLYSFHSLLQDMSLLEIEFFGKIEIIAWLLMTIDKDKTTNNVLLILHISSMSNIYSMNYLTCQNFDKDGDQNTDSPCEQRDCNVVILLGMCYIL